MAQTKVILFACGSFNPPTNMHLRMFEVARDNLNRLGKYLVIGGILSPVHDDYGKQDLVSSRYRCEMVKLALKSSDWIRISYWESVQPSWTRTIQVLQYHQDIVDSLLFENQDIKNANRMNRTNGNYNALDWLSDEVRFMEGPIQIKLLCGADFLESFFVPGLWEETDIETIVSKFGLVVISRQGYDPDSAIYESDILTKHRNNIIIINEWIPNEISSSKIRRALKRQESVKYLIQDSVINFIRENELYNSYMKESKYTYKSNINEGLSIPRLDDFILTPSPSDANMKSVSSSGENIYLELSEISKSHQGNGKRSELKAEESETTELLSPTTDAKSTEESAKKRARTFPREIVTTSSSPGKGKKVGFADASNCWDATPSCSDESDAKSRPDSLSNPSDESSCVEIGKSPTGSAGQVEGSEMAKRYIRRGILLKRSNSDAVVSRGREIGEAVSVRIHVTKDGIKVISDKESIV